MIADARRALDLLAGAAVLVDAKSSRQPVALDAACVAMREARAQIETLHASLERCATHQHDAEIERAKMHAQAGKSVGGAA
jgi:hypothetical protein